MKTKIIFMGSGSSAMTSLKRYIKNSVECIGDGDDVAALVMPDLKSRWLNSNCKPLCTFIVMDGHDVDPPPSLNSNIVIVRSRNTYNSDDDPVTFIMRVNVTEARRNIRSRYIGWLLNTHRAATYSVEGYGILDKVIGEITPYDDLSDQQLWSLASCGFLPPVFYVGRRVFMYEILGYEHSIKIGVSSDYVLESMIRGTIDYEPHKRCKTVHGFQTINQYVVS